MSRQDRDDAHRRAEDRQEDARYARIQEDRESAIARGFSHNPDALYAHYGVPKPESGYLAGYGAQVRDELLRLRRRLLDQLGGWPRYTMIGLHAIGSGFDGLETRILESTEITDAFSDIDVTDPDAHDVLVELRALVTRAAGMSPASLDARERQLHRERLENVQRGLDRLIREHEHYRTVRHHGG